MNTNEYNANIVSIETMSPRVTKLSFQSTEPFEFKAGQSVELLVALNGQSLKFPFSLSSSPENSQYFICFTRGNGRLNDWLKSVKIEDSFSFKGPFGEFLYQPNPDPMHNVVWIATGTGIAPIRSMLFSSEYLKYKPNNSLLLFGAREPRELLFSEEWREFPELNFIPVLSEADKFSWTGETGMVTDYLRSQPSLIEWKNTSFYICGQPEMVKEVRGILHEIYHVNLTHIHHEKWIK